MAVFVAVYFVLGWLLVPLQRSDASYYLPELSLGNYKGQQFLLLIILCHICLETIIDEIVLAVKLAYVER